jgi:phosphatidate phosphatase APP1
VVTTVPAAEEASSRASARLRRFAALVERAVDRLRWGWKRRFGRIAPVAVVPYRGFATAHVTWLEGRVLEAKAIAPAAPGDPPLRNLRRMLRRLTSVEIPSVPVVVRLAGAELALRTDDEGFFRTHAPRMVSQAPRTRWEPISVALAEPVVAEQGVVEAAGELLVPGDDAELAIITDVDDTVIQSHVTDLWKMLRVTLLGSELTRLPFDGTAALFRALAAGPTGAAANPVFYLSRSPYGLYDLLVDFLDRHGLPRGPLLLRDWGLHAEAAFDFKRQRLDELFRALGDLPVVLVGDSGQRDPEVYLEIAALHPGRVRAIYIRDVGRSRKRRAVAELVAEAARQGIEMRLIAHADEALAHARRVGLAA